MEGWREGLGPWTPVLEGDRLYGRGSADDGYAAFASLTAIEADPRGRRGDGALRRPDRGQRGVRVARPAGLRRRPRRADRPTEPRRVPRLRLHRLRPDVGHDVAARPRRRGAVGRHRDRGPPFGRRVGDGSVELPDQPVAAVADRGRGDRATSCCRRWRSRSRPTGCARRRRRRRRSGRSPTTTRSSTTPVRPPTTRSSSSCRERGDRR